MRGTGLTESMMGMELRLGPEAAVIEGNICRDLGMGSVCTDFILEMFMEGSGLTAKVMVVGFILVRMEVDMLGNLSGVSSMALAITISGLTLFFVYCHF